MAIEDFDYILTPYDALTLSNGHWKELTGVWNDTIMYRWNYMKTYGNNGRPQFNESTGKYERTYHNVFECSDYINVGTSTANTIYRPGKIIHHLNYVKRDKLKQLGVMDENNIIKRDKAISVRMKLKISNNIGDQNVNQMTYFRHYAGIVLFGQRPPSILDYQGSNESGVPYNVEKFSFETYENLSNSNNSWEYVGQDDFFVNAPSDLPGNPRYICSGYNFLICSDGKKVDSWDGEIGDWANYEQKRHISLYNYGGDTPAITSTSVGSDPSDTEFAISPWNSSKWKLHQADLIENQMYNTDTWYRIRLDCIPITTFSTKLTTYVARVGDLNWTKTGESIVDETDKKYITTGDIGFVVSTHVGAWVDYTWGNWSRMAASAPFAFHEPYRNINYTEVSHVDASAVVDSFEILTEDIPSI